VLCPTSFWKDDLHNVLVPTLGPDLFIH